MKSLSKTMKEIMEKRNFGSAYEQMMSQVLKDPEVSSFLKNNAKVLSPQAIDRGEAKLYEYYHEKQLLNKGTATVAPGYSPQLIVNAGQIDVTYVPTKKLIEQQRVAHIKQLVSSINMPKFIRSSSFDNFYIDDAHQTEKRNTALNSALDFVEQYSANDFRPGLYLYGRFGVGKTYLLGAIANELARQKGVATTMMHFPSFVVEMRNSIKNNNLGQKLDAVKRAPVLVLDDIGADAMTTWARDDILGVILEYRMQEELPTFFSSNFSMNELQEHLTVNVKGEEEPVKASRIMERIKFLSRQYEMDGANLRDKG
ncbi:MAG: primosomal protein DnaI [Limosilactobacillus sp.]|uniref:primosomal protein DnaI n=1 Tax=Limosilactobacillus sp. TaxID=2773925 RepID=UPI0025BABC6D|nr:primosomal protein DnaI [Limosilactobacillus sp.]MCI1974840.1 primosomal protein DnaI [Limosilactobacillus sp.]MCI2031261.1 primosomal protein DnaI [Limosilactobacillus sp.]